MKRVSMRGKMNALQLNEALRLPRTVYKASSVRSTAQMLKEDLRKRFSVFVGDEEITVTRIE
jgi:hypothetical protein